MAKKNIGLSRGLDDLIAETMGLSNLMIGEDSEPKPVKKQKQKPKAKAKSVAKTEPNLVEDKTEEKIDEGSSSEQPNAEEFSETVLVNNNQQQPIETVSTAVSSPVINSLQYVDISLLKPGRYQPRKQVKEEGLEPLADSIKEQGILQPIVVRKDEFKAGHFEIIAGERRFRASKLAGLNEVPIIVKEVPEDAAMAIALIENMQRENLNPIEEAIALAKLGKKFQLTHQQLAKSVGKSRVYITNTLRLLNLQDETKRLLEDGQIEAGHAKVLLGVQGALQTHLAKKVAKNKLSVRETENLVARAQMPEQGDARAERVDPDIRRLQVELSDKLGMPIKIQHGPSGKGKLIISYNSADELQGVLEHIN